MKCTNCGNDIMDGSNACSMCGMRFDMQYNKPMNQQNQYGQPNIGQPFVGQQNQYGQPNMGQPMNQQIQYGQPNMAQPNMGYNQYAQGNMPQQNQYGQPNMGQSFGNNSFNMGSYNAGIWKYNIFTLISTIILIIAQFVPLVSVSFMGQHESKALIEGDGKIFLILAIVTLVFIFINKPIVVVVTSTLSFLLMLFEVGDFHDKLPDSIYGNLIKKEAGYYLMELGALAMFVTAIVYMVIINKKKKKMY